VVSLKEGKCFLLKPTTGLDNAQLSIKKCTANEKAMVNIDAVGSGKVDYKTGTILIFETDENGQ
jgi:hypothetical protein